MTDRTVSELRTDLVEIVEAVQHRGERVCITKHGRRIVALVPAEDLELLEKLEDRMDLEAVRRALAEPGENVPYATLRKELGIR